MGYMGLRNWGAGDMAASTVHCIQDDMAKRLKSALKDKGNEFNPSGPVNVGLINESFIAPIAMQFRDADGLLEVLRTAHDKLANETIEAQGFSAEDWGGASNRRMHITAYKRLLKSLEKSIRVIKK
jgi:hypothetical protein